MKLITINKAAGAISRGIGFLKRQQRNWKITVAHTSLITRGAEFHVFQAWVNVISPQGVEQSSNQKVPQTCPWVSQKIIVDRFKNLLLECTLETIKTSREYRLAFIGLPTIVVYNLFEWMNLPYKLFTTTKEEDSILLGGTNYENGKILAAAVTFLASDEATFITGQIINID
ncbi:unnamed protein product, partial [marine sediment metagenome]